MFDSYDRSSPQYLKYKNATMVLIGRWLNGIPAPQGVRTVSYTHLTLPTKA